MIVTLEHMWYQVTGGIMMKEVDTEEEAFAEMRRFLQINNVESDVTAVRIVEEYERFGRIVPKHKEVRMCLCGRPSFDGKYADPCFGIYYGTDKPKYMRLKTIEEYGLTIKKDYYGNPVIDQNGYQMLIGDYYEKGNKWYMPLSTYLSHISEQKEEDA